MASRVFTSPGQWDRYWNSREHQNPPDLYTPELRDIDEKAELEDRRRAEKEQKAKERELARKQKEMERRYRDQLEKRINTLEKRKKYTSKGK